MTNLLLKILLNRNQSWLYMSHGVDDLMFADRGKAVLLMAWGRASGEYFCCVWEKESCLTH